MGAPIIGSNRFRAGDFVQEILSFQFRACNFVHWKFRAKEITCMNRNLVHGNDVQEISCTEKGNFVQGDFFLEITCKKEKFSAGKFRAGKFRAYKRRFREWKFRAYNFVHTISCTGDFVQTKFRA